MLIIFMLALIDFMIQLLLYNFSRMVGYLLTSLLHVLRAVSLHKLGFCSFILDNLVLDALASVRIVDEFPSLSFSLLPVGLVFQPDLPRFICLEDFCPGGFVSAGLVPSFSFLVRLVNMLHGGFVLLFLLSSFLTPLTLSLVCLTDLLFGCLLFVFCQLNFYSFFQRWLWSLLWQELFLKIFANLVLDNLFSHL